jgi:hypothetical protein
VQESNLCAQETGCSSVCSRKKTSCTTQSELAHDANMVVCIVVMCSQYVGACSCLS